MSNKLAIHGGEPSINWTPEPYNPIGAEEIDAANRVLKSGILSDFVGAKGEKFLGGKEVRQFESRICDYYGVKHAISVNSWTSGLICALGAIDLEPGDEVIVPPWTMCASATSILVWNAIPIFADIEEDTFNISPQSIIEKITNKTKAIVVPSIFGLPAKLDEILEIAREYGLRVVEDAAQVPGVKYKGKYVGTYGDIGGFSFNYHKHIHCGEGGVCVTNSDFLAEKMRLIRNHAEAAVEYSGSGSLANMIGFNFRLGEIEAAIASEQMDKIDTLVSARHEQGLLLNKGLAGLAGLKTPLIYEPGQHAFYVYPLVLKNIDREKLVNALQAEGVPGLCSRYVNIHRLPMYQKKIAYGSQGYPWTDSNARQDISYSEGICPVAENLNDQTYIALSLCQYAFNESHIHDIISAFHKVWKHLGDI